MSNIFGISQPSGHDPFRGHEFEARQQVIKEGSSLLSSISKLQDFLAEEDVHSESPEKFEKLFSQVLQSFSGFQHSIQLLSKENVVFNPMPSEVRDTYNTLIQPLVIHDYEHLPGDNELSRMRENLDVAKETFLGIINTVKNQPL